MHRWAVQRALLLLAGLALSRPVPGMPACHLALACSATGRWLRCLLEAGIILGFELCFLSSIPGPGCLPPPPPPARTEGGTCCTSTQISTLVQHAWPMMESKPCDHLSPLDRWIKRALPHSQPLTLGDVPDGGRKAGTDQRSQPGNANHQPAQKPRQKIGCYLRHDRPQGLKNGQALVQERSRG